MPPVVMPPTMLLFNWGVLHALHPLPSLHEAYRAWTLLVQQGTLWQWGFIGLILVIAVVLSVEAHIALKISRICLRKLRRRIREKFRQWWTAGKRKEPMQRY